MIGVVRDIDLRIMIDAVSNQIKLTFTFTSILICDKSYIYYDVKLYSQFYFTIFQLDQMPQTVRDHTHVVQLKVNKNANLPFHLLSWGQQYVKEYNCGLLSEKNKQKALSRVLSESATGVRSSSGEEEWTDQHDLMQICATNGIARSRGTPVNVVYHRVSLMHSKNDTAVASAIATANAEADAESAAEEPMVDENGKETKSLPRPRKQAGSKVPIKFVYYTECDQIVHYDSMNTAEAMSSASNESAFFVGRRKEKSPDTEPADYMGGTAQRSSTCCMHSVILSWSLLNSRMLCN